MGIPAFDPERSPALRIEPHRATGLGTGQHNLRIGTPGHAMQLPRSLLAQLDSLSAGFDGDGTDLHAILEVLIDDLAEAVPSFTGLTATMRVNGVAVTFTALAPHAQSTSRASMLLPTADGDSGHSLVFYATSPGAFAELAADARAASGLDGRIVVDGHLPPPAHSDGLEEMAEINQAIGVLIEAGYGPGVKPPHCSSSGAPAPAQPDDRRRRGSCGSSKTPTVTTRLVAQNEQGPSACALRIDV